MARTNEGKHLDYFEAILQLRHVSAEVIEYAEKWLEKHGLQVVHLLQVTNGWDYYLTDNKQAVILGRALEQQFPGHLEVTATLHTQKKEKRLYRLTILFRGMGFKRGDSVRYQGEEYVVKGIGKDILLASVASGKKLHVRSKDGEKIKVI